MNLLDWFIHFLCLSLCAFSFQNRVTKASLDVSMSHRWRSHYTSKRHPYNKTLVTNMSDVVPGCNGIHNFLPQMIVSHFPPWPLCFHFNVLVAMEYFKESSKGACLGALRAGNTIMKEFFHVQAQAGASAYLYAARFVSWVGFLAYVSFWMFPPSWGCPATCWLSQLHACFRCVLGALRQPCRHHRLSPPRK